ncbi:MAG TPA: DUF559 domain-containing protein [Polyangiaceae bacterium]|nr:DUF559 domain-containing protein [Polyangiaceae bacterium]
MNSRPPTTSRTPSSATRDLQRDVEGPNDWRALRSSQLGVAFRRQVPLLGFIADFYAPSARLIVEVDGAYHAHRVSADSRRDRKLALAGYRILRLRADLVMGDLPAALRAVQNALDER